MGLEALTFTSVEPYAEGYEQCTGTAVIALEPGSGPNQVIVDLDRAARDRDGLVRFETDVVLLRAPHHSDLLHVVANRGMVTTLPYGVGLPMAEASGSIDPGDQWVLTRGLSVLWVGWQWDVDRRPGAVGLEVPEARADDGGPLRGQARLGFQPLVDAPRRRLADLVLPVMGHFQALPAADLDEHAAVLSKREWFNGPRWVIDRDRWRFADDEHIELDGGFGARTHYELTYTTRRCPVTGAGLAAVRDVVSHLRAQYRHTFTMGSSQSGRWLRQFLLDTGNADESGQRVFDGVHCHIAGGRRGEFNHRYAQPSTMNPLGFTHLPPFSADDGLFDRARQRGTTPKIIFTNTATEYWRGDGSLSHPSPDGPEWRAYLYAGAHHSSQMPGYVETLPVQLGGNQINIGWPMRAHFEALRGWVDEGTDPPPSAVPREDDATGVPRELVLASLPHYDGLVPPDPEALLGMPPLDLGPDVDRGIGRFPPEVLGPARPCLVSTLDADGNELAGVRLPHVAVPLDVSFGWNPERPRGETPVELWNLVGGRVPFTPEQVVERYENKESYLRAVRAVADELVSARHLLGADVDAVVEDADRRWEVALKG